MGHPEPPDPEPWGCPIVDAELKASGAVGIRAEREALFLNTHRIGFAADDGAPGVA